MPMDVFVYKKVEDESNNTVRMVVMGYTELYFPRYRTWLDSLFFQECSLEEICVMDKEMKWEFEYCRPSDFDSAFKWLNSIPDDTNLIEKEIWQVRLEILQKDPTLYIVRW